MNNIEMLEEFLKEYKDKGYFGIIKAEQLQIVENLINEYKELNINHSILITCITNIAKILQDSIEDGSESLHLIENEIYNTGIFNLN